MSLPNIISLARLCIAPITVWLILTDQFLAAFLTFLIAGASDAIDGFIARRFDSRSELGRYLDPLADKALLDAVFVTLGAAGLMPLWLVILIVFRDLMIVGGVVLGHTLGHPLDIEPTPISKLNTAAQIALAALVLAHHGLKLDATAIEGVMFAVVAGTTLGSGVGYLVRWMRTLSVTEPAE